LLQHDTPVGISQSKVENIRLVNHFRHINTAEIGAKSNNKPASFDWGESVPLLNRSPGEWVITRPRLRGNDMIVLAFVVCLQTDPTVCEDRELVFAEEMSPMACAMRAQPQLAQWAQSRPKWRITEWRCRTVDMREVKI
jgi:hypothetical protein